MQLQASSLSDQSENTSCGWKNPDIYFHKFGLNCLEISKNCSRSRPFKKPKTSNTEISGSILTNIPAPPPPWLLLVCTAFVDQIKALVPILLMKILIWQMKWFKQIGSQFWAEQNYLMRGLGDQPDWSISEGLTGFEAEWMNLALYR